MNQESTLQEIFDIVIHIRDTAATKDDLQELRIELKLDIQNVRTELKQDIQDIRDEIKDVRSEIQEVRDEIQDVRNEMIDHVDGFIGLYKHHELELAAVISRQNRMEERL